MNSTRRIGLLLTLVFLLPALFFSVYELSSLDNDEKMIQDIYAKQLEAILFSVNQYSDDIVGNWIFRISTAVDDTLDDGQMPRRISDLLALNASLRGVFLIDTLGGQPAVSVFDGEPPIGPAPLARVKDALARNRPKIEQLISYKKSGFQKSERLDVDEGAAAEYHCLIFITEPAPKQYRLAGLFIDAALFIEDIVGPRLQTIARDQFILSVLVNRGDSLIYSTQTAAAGGGSQAEALTREFWIFPDYALGIRTSGDTLQQLVRERTTTNFALLIALDVVLIVAVVLVFRNLKKEVNLAQNKADFVSNVSHEIRTPLALISMFAETLEMNRVQSEEKKQEYYRILSRESQRLTGIVNKILSFSQTEAKKKILHIEQLDLSHEVRSILDTYDFHLRNKGFQYSLEARGGVAVNADREALVESVINLIDNAVKYSADIKTIRLTTGADGQFGFVSVEDRGVGISKEHQKHIFDKFYRVPAGDLARSRGTGLGLSLVQQLMQAQRGKITVASEPGKGSVFTLFFPLAKAE